MTGGVCKRQGHIHRKLITSDYQAFRRHEAELQTSICTRIGFRGLTSPFGVVSFCPYHCIARVARDMKIIQTYRCLHLPPRFQGSLYKVLNPCGHVVSNCRYRSCSLPDLTGHLAARADDGHAIPLSALSKVFSLAFILLSVPVRFSV